MKIIEYNNFKIRPLAGAMGAEILDVDLKNINDDTFNEIYKAFVDYQVIGILDQDLNSDQYLEFGRKWGEIHHYPYMKGLETHPEILEIVKTEKDTYAFGNVWHSDGSFTEIPPKATMLYAQELPPAGGDTLFANMYQAYDSLSEAVKSKISNLKAVHAYDYETSVKKASYNRSSAPFAEHPVVRTHPETGRKALYVNRLMTEELVGLPANESKALLEILFSHAERSEHVYEHVWKREDLVFWDNRCTQHARTNFPSDERRLLRRVGIEGDTPF